MKKTIFEGVATALITPFDKNGKIDYKKFAELVEFQISEGINALVVCGTTGEASTLTDDEHKDAIEFVVKQTNGRVPVIAGTGSNDTDYAIWLTKHACEVGADAVLIVTPYYNKATQKGLIKMYTAIADASTKPVIVYNVPSRTGVNIEPATYVALAEHPNIVAIKEANGNISKIAETIALVGDKLDIYSGNDDQIVPILALGGKGVISVLSNPMPKATVEICDRFFKGDIKGSCELQLKLLPLINALFSEVNPIPAKCAMAHMGYTENVLRSPLYPMEEEHEKVLIEKMKEQGIL
ncbi:MAG: 4-hydroxy-tetrahydrodipicolinate synthase [Ruminococcaceae bacterium]|nr:4-hydroxy-tetrahydrodipicolinate synthase [Oscillospiraceae bacterium]